MCFIVTTEKKIATTPIECYKLVTKKRTWWGKKYYLSNMRKFKYLPHKLYIDDSRICLQESNLTNAINMKVVDNGFHSYKTKQYWGPLISCIIPVGAEYYENELFYVSNQIIIGEEIK